jgi:hypothetical protein
MIAGGRHFTLSAGLLLGTATIAVAAQAQSPEPFRASAVLEEESAPRPPRTPSNAAWAYYKAWDTITTTDDRNQFREAVGDRPPAGKPVTRDQRRMLEKHRAFIDGVLAASAMEECDWGSRKDDGLMALLPHLGFTRLSARALGLDARRCAEDGNSVGAAERIVAMLRLSQHASSDAYLISTLVGTAIGHFACMVTEEVMEADQLTAPAARMILAAVRQVDTPDLYNSAAAIELERSTTLNWFRKECVGPRPGLKFVRTLSTAGSLRGEGLGRSHEVAFLLLGFSEQRIQDDIDRADRYFDAVKAAWNKPGAEVALAELETQAAEYQWGFVTQSTSGAFSTVRRSSDRMHETFRKTSGKLKGILDAGEAPAMPGRTTR